jgi:thiol-disulfide isomerase/thioredoxin
MKHILVFLLTGLLFISCDQRPVAVVSTIDQEGLKSVVEPIDNKIKVINFWATWCAPCVEELPYFEEIGFQYKDEVEVHLISLDDAKNIESAVQPFLEENKIKSNVLLLDDPYAAEWIPIIDSHWDGAIPVTLIVSKNKKQFFNKALSKSELEDAVNNFL